MVVVLTTVQELQVQLIKAAQVEMEILVQIKDRAAVAEHQLLEQMAQAAQVVMVEMVLQHLSLVHL